MAMQIPVSLPEPAVSTPSIRRDVQAASPVSAVPSTGGTTEAPDPRLSLQWAQPVLGQPGSDATRAVPERVSAQSPAPLAASSQGPASSASASVQWSDPARTLSQLLQARGAQDFAAQGVPWPAADAPDPNETLPPAQQVLHFMQRLYRGLAQSDLFAAQHLVQAWHLAKSKDPASVRDMASQAPDSATFARWLDALAPESASAEQVAHMLVSGKMEWHGEMLPGVTLHIQREDAWREDPAHPGQAQKGARLHIEVDLPQAGTLRVQGSQWGEHMDIRVKLLHPKSASLQAAWPQLQARMAALPWQDLQLSWEASA